MNRDKLQVSEPISGFLTKHAVYRMHSRRIAESAVVDVLAYGREVRIRGAVIYAIGKNEVGSAKKSRVDLRSREGLHVVCTSEGTVLTVYRNRNFSGLHPKHRNAWNLRLPSSNRKLQTATAGAAA
jgi:hypothetical protein